MAIPGVVAAFASACAGSAQPTSLDSAGAVETPRVLVEAVRVHRGAIARVATGTGEVQALQQIQIASQIEATVLAVRTDIGDRVRQGQPLVELDCRLLRAELGETEAALERSTGEAARARRLVDAGLGEERRLEAAVAQERIDRARVERLRTQVGFCQLTSPLTGVVVARSVFAGDLARPGTPLLAIVDVSRLRVRVPLPEPDAATVSIGAPAEVRVDALGGRPVAATVSRIWPGSDPATHRTTVELDLGAVWPAVRPGYLVHARIPTAQRDDVLLVDRRALLPNTNGIAEIFVIDRGVARRRSVELGLASDLMIEVHTGIEEGDLVVVRGAERLSDGTEVRLEEVR